MTQDVSQFSQSVLSLSSDSDVCRKYIYIYIHTESENVRDMFCAELAAGYMSIA